MPNGSTACQELGLGKAVGVLVLVLFEFESS